MTWILGCLSVIEQVVWFPWALVFLSVKEGL